MFWASFNAFCSIIVAIILTFDLGYMHEKFTPIERVGMGILGGSMVLSIGPLWVSNSPFEDWSSGLLRLGCAIYFVGRMTRHKYNNWAQIRSMRKELAERRTSHNIALLVLVSYPVSGWTHLHE